MVSIGEAPMQGGGDIIHPYVMVSIGGALMQEGCEIIGPLCYGVNRKGLYHASLCSI